jgi:hypothetical protein
MKTLTAGFVIIACMALAAQGQEFNTLSHKPMISATSTPYLADPTGGNDATTPINNCIHDAVTAHAVCVLPPGTYKITGSGLTFPPPPTGTQAALLGLQNVGAGTASLVYYGSGTAITIGNCSDTSHLLYSINLVNIAINQASGTKAQYGIQACGLSTANWDGLSVGNGSLTGYFTRANIRFKDSSEIDLQNLLVANTPYQSGTTAILFDDVGNAPGGGGNANITIHGAGSAIYGFQKAIVCKSCINIGVRDALMEANDYGLFVDNSTWTSPSDALENVQFQNTEFLMDPQLGPTHNKVLQVNSTGGAKLLVRDLVFRSTKWQLSGGVTYPVELNIPSTGPYSVFSLKLDTNSIAGANTAVVDSDNPLAAIFFTGENDITDASGVTRPANVHGAATVTDYAHPIAVNVLTESGTNNAIVTVPSPPIRISD